MHYLVKPVGKNIIAAALAPSALYVKNPEKVQNCQKKIRQTEGRGNPHCFLKCKQTLTNFFACFLKETLL